MRYLPLKSLLWLYINGNLTRPKLHRFTPRGRDVRNYFKFYPRLSYHFGIFQNTKLATLSHEEISQFRTKLERNSKLPRPLHESDPEHPQEDEILPRHLPRAHQMELLLLKSRCDISMNEKNHPLIGSFRNASKQKTIQVLFRPRSRDCFSNFSDFVKQRSSYKGRIFKPKTDSQLELKILPHVFMILKVQRHMFNLSKTWISSSV